MQIVDVKATRYTEATDRVDIGAGYEVLVCEVETDEDITGMSYIPYNIPPAPGFGLKLDPELAARCKVAD